MWLYEDNQATSRIITTGKFPTMRHVKRMHGVGICWMHDTYKSGVFKLFDCHTSKQAADVFTKHFINSDKWEHAVRLIGLVPRPRERFRCVTLPGLISEIRSHLPQVFDFKSGCSSPTRSRIFCDPTAFA